MPNKRIGGVDVQAFLTTEKTAEQPGPLRFVDVAGDALVISGELCDQGERFAVIQAEDVQAGESIALNFDGPQLDGLIEHLCRVRAWVG